MMKRLLTILCVCVSISAMGQTPYGGPGLLYDFTNGMVYGKYGTSTNFAPYTNTTWIIARVDTNDLLASSNWVVNTYYPRSNPSNWITSAGLGYLASNQTWTATNTFNIKLYGTATNSDALGGIAAAAYATNAASGTSLLAQSNNTWVVFTPGGSGTNYWPRQRGWRYTDTWDFTNDVDFADDGTVTRLDLSGLTNSDGSVAIPDGATYIYCQIRGTRSSTGGGVVLADNTNLNGTIIVTLTQVPNITHDGYGNVALLSTNKEAWIYASPGGGWAQVKMRIQGAGR